VHASAHHSALGSPSANWKAIADTSGDVLYREVDFNIERQAARSFAANFEGSKAIKVPKVYEDLSSSKVLTMEYCPGTKISDHEALKREGFDQVRISRAPRVTAHDFVLRASVPASAC
jgi:predicted unusual protein kinase regulating ubiquinone biosynthesis (AarF/ABC1/UbiB family)